MKTPPLQLREFDHDKQTMGESMGIKEERSMELFSDVATLMQANGDLSVCMKSIGESSNLDHSEILLSIYFMGNIHGRSTAMEEALKVLTSEGGEEIIESYRKQKSGYEG